MDLLSKCPFIKWEAKSREQLIVNKTSSYRKTEGKISNVR